MSFARKMRVGVFALLVAGAAALLNGLFNGLGVGDGDGFGLLQQGRDEPRPAPTERDAPPVDEEEETTETVQKLANSDVKIYVVIDGSQYFLADSPDDENPQPVDLERIIELGKKAQGDIDGTKVHISRGPNSLPTPENNLRDALLNAGLDDSAVRWD